MKNYSSTNWVNLSFKKFAFALVVFLATLVTHVHAQTASTANYAFTTNTTGSLGLDANGNIVDMSAGTTQLVAANQDDNSSSATAIGFTFNLMGNPYTQFVSSSNGIVQLGSSSLSTTAYSLAGSVASPRIGALAADLRTGSSGKVHYKLIGTAPNRCLVVEFLNMSLTFVGSPGSNDGTYQVRLYETTGVIEFVYGSMYRNASTTSETAIYSGFSVGSTANTQASITTATNTVSTGATFNANTYTLSTNIANLHSTAEGSRRMYIFTPPAIPVAPTALNFTAVGASAMTLNWTDNSSTEFGYQVYASLDGVTYTLVTPTLPANTVTYTATALAQSTLYYWKVVALSETGVGTPDLLGSQMTTAGTLSGIKTVGTGGDYDNLTTAFAAINNSGLSGDIELQLIAGYPAAPETYPIASSTAGAVASHHVKVYPTVSGLSITSANTTGTLNLNNGKNITFDGRVNQTGANDLVIANTNAGTSYAIQMINDANNNLFSHCIIQSSNTSATSGTIVIGTTTGANGNDNNTIDACDIRDGATTPANAIYSVGTTATAAQNNDNITISNNNISNFFNAGVATVGVYAGAGNNAWTITANKLFQTATRTYTTGNTHNGIQVANSSGNGFTITNNTIGFANAAGTGTYTMDGTVATRFLAINVSAGTTTASTIQGNTVKNIALTTSATSTGAGVFAGITVSNGNINIGNVTPNIIGATTGNDVIVVTASAAGGLVNGINSSSGGTVNISNNQIGGLTAAGSAVANSVSITGIQVSAGTPTIDGNTVGSTSTANSINSATVATGGSQLVRGIDVTSGVTTATSIQNNTVANLNQNGTTTGASIRGISYAGTGVATISFNTVHHISGATANTAVSGAATAVQGILHTGSATAGAVINKNVIYAISATNTGAVQTNVVGIGYSNPTTGSITANKIYDLRNASTMAVVTTPPTASGILIRALATSVNVYNNMISLGDAQTTNTQFTGIWNSFSTVGTIGLYNNSISISGTAASGALPSYGVHRGDNSATAVTTPVDIRNNILSNTRTGGTGKHYAIANQAGTASTTGWGANATNYNLLNAAPATIGLWGAIDETFAAWQTASAGGANSHSGLALTFVNVATGDLHLNMGATLTPIESGATAIAAVTVDFDGDARPGPAGSVNGGATAPDMGADEFDGMPASPIITLNSVTPPAAMACVTAARLVSVNVVSPIGTTSNVTLSYSFNGAAPTPIAMTNTSGTTWEASIPASTPANATVTWTVTALSSATLTSVYNGATYKDEPLTGFTASASAASATLCSGTPTDLTATLQGPGTVQIGAATTTTAATSQPTAFCNRWPSYRMQTIYTAAELQAAGLRAGPITSMAFRIISLGDGATNGSFTVKAGTTAQTTFTDFISSAGFTTVFPAATYTHAIGWNTITFSTPYNWDGVSNLVLEVSHNGANATNNSETYYTATAGNTVAWSTSGSATGTPSSNRLNVVFGGTVAGTMTAISWSDGMTTVGTTNPLSVSPTTTTTYTASITSAGCVVTPAPTVAVTVNPLPTAPTASNSAQCGSQVATASVTSTTAQVTPTFNWYDAATAGVLLQSSTSTTLTSVVAATSTFYVSEVDGVTGCESPRTAVTVTVASADIVAANADPVTICLGSDVELQASNTNATPLQNYTYSWLGTTGSGVEMSMPGDTITITPTAAGTYVYTLSAIDGLCAGSATVSVTVNPNPTSVVANASSTDICNGTAINLTSTATTNSGTGIATPLAQDFNSGLGGWTTTYSGTAPASTGWAVQNAPYSYSTYFTSFATPNGGGFAMSNADMGSSGNKTRAKLISPVFSTMNMLDATLTFQNLYRKWSSDSLARLEISTDGGATWVTLKDYTADQGVITNNAQVPANESIVLGAAYLNQPNLRIRYNYVSAWGYFWIIDDVKISGNADASTYAWVSAPAGFTSTAQNPTGVTPAVGTTYTVTVTNSHGCSASGDVAVAVRQPSTSTVTLPPVCVSTTLNGTTYTATGTYIQHLTNAAGCDSAITVNVTILNPTTNTITASSCVSYTLNASTYTTSGTYTQVLPGANAVGCDSTITLHLTIKQPTTHTITTTACDSYTLNASTYTTSGTYTQHLTNVAGCDSTITLNLTVNHATSSTLSFTACGSFTYNGTTYNTSGTYPATLTNAAGCDSLVTLNLTINQPTANTISVTGCNSATVNGTTYNASGTYTQTLVNAVGCDSTLTINVTLNSTSSTITEVACSSFTYNGTTYNASGTYNTTLVNAAGCDSLVTLNLTINQPTTSTITDVACNAYTLNGTTYTASGTYTQVLENAAGCDSTITLNLTVNLTTTATLTVAACDEYTYDGTTYTASGTYPVVLTNAAGCDSLVTLVLTINTSPVATATDNGDLTITASSGASYQWVHCVTGLPIAGATSQTFTATVNGNYAVIVTNASGCSDTSNCVVIDNVGMDELKDAAIQVFPNPTHTDVTIMMSTVNAVIEVVDAQGKTLKTVTVSNGSKVDLSAYETGVYFLRIQTDKGSAIERIVKN